MIKRLYAQLVEYAFSFPMTAEPLWRDRVDRWYQLDALSFGLTDAVWSWKEKKHWEMAGTVVLASPGASNESDFAFASQGASSAQKFAHTLPNVRFSPVAQVMNWHGVSLCLQNDPYTLASAVGEAAGLVGPNGGVTLLSVFEKRVVHSSQTLMETSGGAYLAVGLNLFEGPRSGLPLFSLEVDCSRDLKRTDAEVLAWWRKSLASQQ